MSCKQVSNADKVNAQPALCTLAAATPHHIAQPARFTSQRYLWKLSDLFVVGLRFPITSARTRQMAWVAFGTMLR